MATDIFYFSPARHTVGRKRYRNPDISVSYLIKV